MAVRAYSFACHIVKPNEPARLSRPGIQKIGGRGLLRYSKRVCRAPEYRR